MLPRESRRAGILIFDEVEELDFVGPWEVFGQAERVSPGSFETRLLSLDGKGVRAAYGLKIEASVAAQDALPLDILVVPGGKGARREMNNPEMLDLLRGMLPGKTVIASVCTGSLILTAAGILDGKRATTHWAALEDLRAFPKVTVDHQRYIDLGDVVTSAGISAGIDMALHLVERFLGKKEASEVAKRMEYHQPLSQPVPGA
ncbi:MAG: DJ-1/PfpI family protein [Thermoplasmata archaeon]